MQMLGTYEPTLDDLWFRQSLMCDEATMTYNHAYGGVIQFPTQKWESWYNHYIKNNECKRFYRYLLDNQINEYVGEISYHYDDNKRGFICSIIVLAKYRGHGYGTQGLNLLCEYASKNGISILYDDIAADNPSLSMFIKNGFLIEYQNNQIVMLKKVL